jgi:hypothetical protein
VMVPFLNPYSFLSVSFIKANSKNALKSCLSLAKMVVSLPILSLIPLFE